jgi:hypothetical protein
MGKEIADLLVKPMYVYLIGILYLVYKISFVPFNIDLLVTLIYLLVFSTITFCSVFIFKKVFKFKYFAIVVTAFWIMFLFHVHILGLFETFIKPPHIVRYIVLWPSIILTGFVIAWISSKLHTHNLLLNKIANVFLLCAIFVIIINTTITIYTTINRLNNNYKKQEYLTKSVSNKKDIIWILMDEYSNSSYLQSRFNFKNPMDSLLKRKGFHVFNKIHSRFNATLYSVNSIFNLDDSIQPYNFDYGNYSLKNSALPRLLDDMNYKFINESFFNIGSHRQIEVSSFYSPTLLFKLIDGTILQRFLQLKMTKLYKEISNPEKSLQKNYNDAVLSALNTSLREKHSTQVYFWAHLLIPHYPLLIFKNQKPIVITPTDSLGMKKGYIDYLSYGNQLILNLWKDHPVLKDKIVIISGDHGVRYGFLGKDDHQLRPFCALYMPPGIDTTGIGNIQYISQLPAFVLKRQK